MSDPSYQPCTSTTLGGHVPRAMDRVYSCVRISRMNEDLFVLLEPRVHLIPVKSEVIFQCRSSAGRIGVSAGRVVGDAILYHQAPANGVCRLLRLLQILHPDIRSRKPVSRRPLRFIDEENVLAVGDQLSAKVRPYSARAAFDVYPLLQPRPLLGSRNNWSCGCLSHLESPFLRDDGSNRDIPLVWNGIFATGDGRLKQAASELSVAGFGWWQTQPSVTGLQV